MNVTGIGCQPLMKNNQLSSNPAFKGYEDDLEDTGLSDIYEKDLNDIHDGFKTIEDKMNKRIEDRKTNDSAFGKFVFKAGSIFLFAAASGLAAKFVLLNGIATRIVKMTGLTKTTGLGGKAIGLVRKGIEHMEGFTAGLLLKAESLKPKKPVVSEAAEEVIGEVKEAVVEGAKENTGKFKTFINTGKEKIGTVYSELLDKVGAKSKSYIDNAKTAEKEGVIENLYQRVGIETKEAQLKKVPDEAVKEKLEIIKSALRKGDKLTDDQKALIELSADQKTNAKANFEAGRVAYKMAGDAAFVVGATTGLAEGVQLDEHELKTRMQQKAKDAGTAMTLMSF